jgi:hypothetical protein
MFFYLTMRNALLLPSVLLTLAALFPGAGCADECAGLLCGACWSAISLQVKDADTGEALADFMVTGADTTCRLTTVCDIGTEPGTYQLHVEATGYAPADVTIEVPAVGEIGCCECGYDQVAKTITLTKA